MKTSKVNLFFSVTASVDCLFSVSHLATLGKVLVKGSLWGGFSRNQFLSTRSKSCFISRNRSLITSFFGCLCRSFFFFFQKILNCFKKFLQVMFPLQLLQNAVVYPVLYNICLQPILHTIVCTLWLLSPPHWQPLVCSICKPASFFVIYICSIFQILWISDHIWYLSDLLHQVQYPPGPPMLL